METCWTAVVAVAAGLAVGSIQAQDTFIAEAEAIEAVPPAERAAAMVRLYDDSPNGFVYALQSELRARGLDGFALNGLFDRATINALAQFCGDVGIVDICRRGPLSLEGAQAIAGTLFGENQTDMAVEDPAPEPAITITSASEMSVGKLKDTEEATESVPARRESDTVLVAQVPSGISDDRTIWHWNNVEIQAATGNVISDINLLRNAVYDPVAERWLKAPTDFEPNADGIVSIEFVAGESGTVRIYPLRGRDSPSWVYTVVDGLEAGRSYLASWTVSVQGTAYTVTGLKLEAR